MNLKYNLSRTLQFFKDQKKLSSEEFASELSISKTTLQSYLKEDGNPGIDTLHHLGEKLGPDFWVQLFTTYSEKEISIVDNVVNLIIPFHRLDEEEREALWEHINGIITILGRGKP